MEIRKLYKFEAAHRVRTSTGSRCRESIHGHSYLVEVFLSGSKSGDMIIDFGDLKPNLGVFFDCLDHATFIWLNDNPEYLAFVHKFSRRVIEMQRDPTAENMARAFLKYCHNILKECGCPVAVTKVRVHETATGYAEADTFFFDDNLTIEHPNDD